VAPKHVDFFKLRFDALSLARRKALAERYGLDATSKYGDTFWTEAAAERKAVGLTFAKWLVTRGQRIDEKTARGTALHVAARAGNVATVKWLLANGAAVDIRAHGETPLESALLESSNIDLERVVPVVRALLSNGAKVTPAARRAAKRIYEEMDYYRDEMTPAFRRRCEADAKTICKAIGVTPPDPRRQHDGKSAILVAKGSLAKRFSALWTYLVPARGPAVTMQGEVVRIAGRINDELARNGGVNWDADYRLMARAFADHVAKDRSLSAREIAAVEGYVHAVSKKRPDEDDARLLCDAAVAWVIANPIPKKRGRVRYRR
jgi:hypothetical protein